MGSGIEAETGVQLLASYIALLTLSSVAMILRLIARSTRGRRPGWDDAFVVLAWMLSVGIFVTSMLGVNRGWGMHVWDVSEAQLRNCMKQLYVFLVLWNPSILATKLSILFFYHRINPGQNFRRLVYLVMASCVITSIAVYGPLIFQCRPISRFWDRDKPGTCMNLTAALFANTICGVITDLIILVMPLPMVFRLRIRTKQKIGLVVIFSIGIFTCLTASARFPFIHKFDSEDPLYDATYGGLWSYAEVNCGIICACLPALRSLFRKKKQPSDHSEQSESAASDWQSEKAVQDEQFSPPDGSLRVGEPCRGDEVSSRVVVVEEVEREVPRSCIVERGIMADTEMAIFESSRIPRPPC